MTHCHNIIYPQIGGCNNRWQSIITVTSRVGGVAGWQTCAGLRGATLMHLFAWKDIFEVESYTRPLLLRSLAWSLAEPTAKYASVPSVYTTCPDKTIPPLCFRNNLVNRYADFNNVGDKNSMWSNSDLKYTNLKILNTKVISDIEFKKYVCLNVCIILSVVTDCTAFPVCGVGTPWTFQMQIQQGSDSFLGSNTNMHICRRFEFRSTTMGVREIN